MVPVPVTDDYYQILEVEQTAAIELIHRSYKRLALKLHPDRNKEHNATAAFQLLGRAYETLKEVSKRREYDLKYPSIIRNRPSTQKTQPPRPPPTSTPQSEALNEATHIAAIEKSKRERNLRWQTKKSAFDSSISKMQSAIRQLEEEIKKLGDIAIAEAAEDAYKNSWAAWTFSLLSKKVEESEEEKAIKEIRRQERRMEKDMKERRLHLKTVELRNESDMLAKAKQEVDAADLVDNRKLRMIQEKIQMRETRERQERERLEREKQAKMWQKQQDEWEKRRREAAEAAEALRKQQEEVRAAAQKKQEEANRQFRKRQAEMKAAAQKLQDEADREWQRQRERAAKEQGKQRAACGHGGWWDKVEGRLPCPECSDVWNYLLKCPGCSMKACPKCQSVLRPRRSRGAARNNRNVHSEARTPQHFYYDDY